MERALFKTASIHSWIRNKEECRMWLLCSLRLGIYNDIRRYLLRYLLDPVYNLDVIPTHRSSDRMYRTMQKEQYALWKTDFRSGTTLGLISAVVNLVVNATTRERQLNINVTCASPDLLSSFLRTVFNKLYFKNCRVVKFIGGVLETSFAHVSSCSHDNILPHGYDIFIIDNVPWSKSPLYDKSFILNHDQSKVQFFFCGFKSWFGDLTELQIEDGKKLFTIY